MDNNRSLNNSIFEIIMDYNDSPMLSKPITYNYCVSHFHRQLEILYVISGKNEVTIGEKTHVLTANQMAIADSFVSHQYKTLGDVSICMILPYNALRSFVKSKNGGSLSENFIFDEGDALEFLDIIKLIDKYWANPKSLIIDGLFNAFLGLILEKIPIQKNKATQNNLLVNEILYYIEDNFRSNITLESMSSNFSYSKYYFSKLFNTAFNCHFNDYINMVRTRNVLYLIKEKGGSTTNAILESGFSSIPTFYRYFKEHFNLTPSEYLEQNIQTTPFVKKYPPPK